MKITKGICIGLPAMDGKIEMELMDSMIMLYLKCKSKGIPLVHINVAGASLITKCRNDLANTFMYEMPFSHFLFIDSDLVFDPDNIIQMYEADKNIIAGTYVKKYIDWNRLNQVFQDPKNKDDNIKDLMAKSGDYNVAGKLKSSKKSDPIMEADGVATGMLMIKRQVFKKIQEYILEDEYYIEKDRKNYGYFETILHKGEHISEDYSFCKRATFAGFKINILTNCNTAHIGRIKYYGNLKTRIDYGN
tara:strand:- start:11512 stop:12252 length:741 start_codon:yes stop_codon:yes gene_type:complete